MTFKIGERVRHARAQYLTGTVIGYGVMNNPWSQELQSMHLVQLDESIGTEPKPGTRYAMVSVITMHERFTEAVDA